MTAQIAEKLNYEGRKTDTLVLSQWGVRPKLNVGMFDEKQKIYLAHHWDKFFK